jgi:hypothetical protein
MYNWVMRLAAGKRAEPALACVSFAESSFFPIPPDVMLAPMCVARPDRWLRYAFRLHRRIRAGRYLRLCARVLPVRANGC